MKNYKRYLITSALPYANGPLHIGHLAGVYVPSDIYTRYLRMKGADVISICGSDEHGVPITLKARNEGITPQEVVDRYHAINKKAFEDFGIAFDIYSRTSNKIHYETASDFFLKLYKKGEFVEKTSEQYYDEEAGCFLADRYIVGTCPHCGNENAYGDQCEKCGTSLSPNDLINPHSTISGSKPVLRETLHWYLPLDRYEGWLRQWILEDHKEWKTNVYGQCKSWIDQGLQPRAVSRDLDWGVPVPVEGAEGKVLYVWFDAPIGYISATRELTPDWEKYWKDPETKMVHFIGKDNIEGAPDLIVEVLSPGTSAKDLRPKKALYERAGVSEYLVVDPLEHYAIRFLHGAEGYDKGTVFAWDEILTFATLADVEVPLWEVFGLPGPGEPAFAAT